MNYVLNITEITDVNNKTNYYVFDSFGTFLGAFKNISLAYDLIIAYFEYLENTYKVGEFSNLKKQINEALNGKNNFKLQDYDSITFIDEMIHSMKKLTRKEYEKDGVESFSTSPIMLGREFVIVFNEQDINEVHWAMLKKIKDDKFKSDENFLAYFKEPVTGKFSESDFSRYFSPLSDLNRNDAKRNDIKKEIKK